MEYCNHFLQPSLLHQLHNSISSGIHVTDPLLVLVALLMLVFGAAVVVNRNPIASALNLVVSFLASPRSSCRSCLLHRHYSSAGLCGAVHGSFSLHHHAARPARGKICAKSIG